MQSSSAGRPRVAAAGCPCVSSAGAGGGCSAQEGSGHRATQGTLKQRSTPGGSRCVREGVVAASERDLGMRRCFIMEPLLRSGQTVPLDKLLDCSRRRLRVREVRQCTAVWLPCPPHL
ncbi:hypothetical protein BDU57DRAFT_286099 [Ampelomyces quisqualis]|uniref:Uncharacterized protein n=1 Tax=Ampelomyces quisqualis TaxID=50730 RepID=A0A6A5QF53_AMPQU|nr:hypothetical protein BDU57DRAFT_286099 [Ampelomyces quisqualis]